MARFLVVDPEPFFCQALETALGQSGAEVVGWTTDERAAVRLADVRRPDVVLTEVELDQGSGLSLMRRLRGRVPVVALTRHLEGEILLDVAASGGLGCLSHDLSIDALASQASVAGSGTFTIDPGRLHEALTTAANRVARADQDDVLGYLSAREREILDLLSDGLDNDAIADNLYLSPNTIRTHIGNILKKLGVHSRADAARLALRVDSRPGRIGVLEIHGPDLREPR